MYLLNIEIMTFLIITVYILFQTCALVVFYNERKTVFPRKENIPLDCTVSKIGNLSSLKIFDASMRYQKRFFHMMNRNRSKNKFRF